MKKVIILSGKAGVGKTETQGGLAADLRTGGEYVELVSFAGLVKSLARDLFWWEGDKKLYKHPNSSIDESRGRGLLIGIGSRMRELWPSVWVANAERRIADGPSGAYIIDDARFPNEIAYLKHEYGDRCLVIRLTRDGLPQIDDETETALDKHQELFDHVVSNNGTVGELMQKVCAIVEKHYASLKD